MSRASTLAMTPARIPAGTAATSASRRPYTGLMTWPSDRSPDDNALGLVDLGRGFVPTNVRGLRGATETTQRA